MVLMIKVKDLILRCIHNMIEIDRCMEDKIIRLIKIRYLISNPFGLIDHMNEYH